MIDYSDPKLYISIGSAIAAMVIASEKIITNTFGAKRHREQLDYLLSILPDKPTDESPLQQRLRWAEGLAAFDKMTLPTTRPKLAKLCVVVTIITGIIATVAVQVVITPEKFSSSKPDDVRFLAFECAVISALVCFLSIRKANELYKHAFQLGGQRLHPGSKHIPYIRDLRQEFGVANSEDKKAIRNIRLTACRSSQFTRAVRKARHLCTNSHTAKRARVIRHARIQAPARIIKKRLKSAGFTARANTMGQNVIWEKKDGTEIVAVSMPDERRISPAVQRQITRAIATANTKAQEDTEPQLYRVDAYREGRWWMIRVPQLDGHVDADGARLVGEAITQARRFADITREATDFICVVTDSAPSAVELDIHTSIGGEDYLAQASDVIELKKRAHTLEREALEKSRHVARQLASEAS